MTAWAGPTVQRACSSQMSPDTISQETPGKHLNFADGRVVAKGLLPAELLSPCLQEAAEEPHSGRDPGGMKPPLSFFWCPDRAKG